jgi:16S rRNA (uracil1498-N3)-methyltransferase
MCIVTRMSERFYVNCPLAPGPVIVSGAEAHHLATVCRLRPGNLVCLFNGDGHEYPAEVISTAKHAVTLEVLRIESPVRELSFRLEVAAPLPKGDRAQFLLEKLTELGVTSFTPLQTRRSVVHPREAKLEKLQRWVIEASKQCGRNTLLRVEPLIDWEGYCRRGGLPAQRIVAHVGETETWQPRREDVVIAVGPEGGFTKEEIELAFTNSWRSMGLGRRILRVETAAIVLAALSGYTSERSITA